MKVKSHVMRDFHHPTVSSFKIQNFEVLIGAARVLCETIEMNIGEVLKTGGFKLAKHFCHQDTKNTKFC